MLIYQIYQVSLVQLRDKKRTYSNRKRDTTNESTKLDASKGFFDRLDKFETASTRKY